MSEIGAIAIKTHRVGILEWRFLVQLTKDIMDSEHRVFLFSGHVIGQMGTIPHFLVTRTWPHLNWFWRNV